MVGVTDGTQRLDWYVPADEWDRFREWVHDEVGTYDGALGREAESAMLEWVDEDDYSHAETLVDRLVEAAGRRPSAGVSKNKNSLSDALDGDTTRVTVRVRSSVREQFRDHVRDHADNPTGRVLARALREYRLGGRAARLTDKLERVVDDAERVLSELEATADAGDDDDLGERERKVVAIADQLGEEFVDDELVDAIHRVAGRGPTASDPTVETYRELVTDHLDVEPHPNTPDVWIPRDEARRIAGDVPAVVRQPVCHLDHDERVRRLRLALGHRAGCNNGKARVTTDEVRTAVFDAEIARQTAVSLMQDAAFIRGFETDENDRCALRANLRRLTDDELVDDLNQYGETADSGLLDAPTETRLDDYDHDTDMSKTNTQNVDAQLDKHQRATPVADGGDDAGGDRR